MNRRIVLLAAVLAMLAATVLAPARAAALEPSSKLVIIPLENKSRTLAERKMPNLVALQRRYAYATSYFATDHPSLPDYVVWSSGKNYGITDDKGPKAHPLKGQSVWGAAAAHGVRARVYGDAQQGNCPLTDQGSYMKVRHLMAISYFVDERATCQSQSVPLQPALGQDETAGMPGLSAIVGSTLHDGHTPSTAQDADAWLKNTILPPLMASDDFISGRLTIVITFDEGKDADQNVSFVVLNAALDGAHLVVTDRLDHTDMYRSMLRYGGSIPSGTDALAVFGL